MFQVIRWIHSAEGMLSAGFSIPGSLQDAEQLKKEHEQFQTAIEVRLIPNAIRHLKSLAGVLVSYFKLPISYVLLSWYHNWNAQQLIVHNHKMVSY